jgi:group I intron endonuclease
MEATEQLKNNFSKSGIYCIKNKENNKLYIGSAKNFKKRFTGHLSKLNTATHNNSYLLNAYNKNKTAFEMDILEIVEDLTILRNIEQKYINTYNTCNSEIGYNLTNNTHCCSKNNIVKKKISISTKNIMLQEIQEKGEWKLAKYQFIKGIIPWNKGKKLTNTQNFHTRKTITSKVLESRQKSALLAREKGMVIVCLNKDREELFVFRSLQDTKELINQNASYGFTVSLSRLSKAIKFEKLYKKHYFIKRVPNKSDFIRKSDELLETLT